MVIVAVSCLNSVARAAVAPWSRQRTSTPPPPLLCPGPTCCAALAKGLPFTPVAMLN